MELSFSELSNRDVINIADGKCLGKITDIKLTFPSGELIGIVVPGRKTNWFFRIFDRSELYIDVNKINKIGGDVILVNINCGDVCSPSAKATVPTPCNPCSPCSPCGTVGNQTSSFDE